VEVPSWLLHMEGSKGTLRYDNALFPFVYHRIVKPNGEVEQHYSFQDNDKDTIGKTTYEYQLDKFVRIVQQEQHNYNHHQAVAKLNQALLDSMIRNSELAEAIVTASRQEPLRAWPCPPPSSSLLYRMIGAVASLLIHRSNNEFARGIHVGWIDLRPWSVSVGCRR
jgi:hypothetical protein